MTIRFDASDCQVFERAAEPKEWAVSGAFAFADADPSTLTAKRRQSFSNGFLGTASFGWSTLVCVVEGHMPKFSNEGILFPVTDHLRQVFPQGVVFRSLFQQGYTPQGLRMIAS